MNDEPPDRPTKVGFITVVKSVLASFFGVQSQRNRERDFTGGNPLHFILVGLAATLGFVLIMWGLVSLILSFST